MADVAYGELDSRPGCVFAGAGDCAEVTCSVRSGDPGFAAVTKFRREIPVSAACAEFVTSEDLR